MPKELRKTGISLVGDMPWGTHFCHFYETKEDLLDILIPYFKTGLENNEFCMWIIFPPHSEEEVREALRRAIPGVDQRMAAGDIEIWPHARWYLKGGSFGIQEVIDGWQEKLTKALARGYAGMRVNGNEAWLTKKDWIDFSTYEEKLNNMIANRRMIVMCTYLLTLLRASEVFDVTRTHQFAVAKRRGKWEVVETPALKQAKDEIKRLNEELEQRVVGRTRELATANKELEKEIIERKRAEEALQQARDTLEQRVAERTSELARSNEQLSREIEVRKRAEEALRESERQLKRLSTELLKAQENERKRIANEIHDSIGQSLYAIKAGLAELMHRQGLLPKGARFLEDLLSKIDFAIEEVRNIYTGLRPSILDDLGILATMRWFLREFRKTYPDIVIEDKINACEEDVPEPLKIIIFRVLQAARDNIARHSKAKYMRISLQGGDAGIELVIQDDGIGFRLEDALFAGESGRGLGLVTMQEQIESSGGIFTITSVKGDGTTLRAVWHR
jgi:signal transduction histidine kinase